LARINTVAIGKRIYPQKPVMCAAVAMDADCTYLTAMNEAYFFETISSVPGKFRVVWGANR
jgi:hypothetical protein